ncbi:MerR family transcriptional regulator [Coxiella endosymbiont of Ornithodoros maritimus]|uniref:hypothetical protein n=1 Tax=Coxiella endosymbiont of Ornithodoros maritimus TaxID=1656172 RepID=UPI0022652B13|nr:hypothetical protein [Coxiella endosymbiont of Ornithodoros maritimus]
MYKSEISLSNLPHTGLVEVEDSSTQGTDFIEYNPKVTPVLVAALVGVLAIGTGTTQLGFYPLLGQESTAVVGTQSQQSAVPHAIEMRSFNEQLQQVKRSMGLNVLELAAILRVTRPTIYGWMASEEIEMRKKN